MSVVKVVMSISLIIAVISCVSAIPQPSVVREKYIIHAPIKFRTIHHHKIRKIPILVKKHVYHFKNKEDIKPVVEEDYDNHIHNDYTDHNLKYNAFDLGHTYGKYNGEQSYNDYNHQEDYDDAKQLEEEDYEDYEYE